ncbi:unnamed protein product [Mytilus coruscus]|uniref:Uncharacterized protein n=1 Tax=Mytilus coruscus TaxID=42192 RepID=A0A6J8DA57_MYTCO|nr:unnamed protein product [Mytilus coruscus]
MTRLYKLYILILIFLSHVYKTSSKETISLEFRFKKDTLQLICKVWNPSLSINFYSTDDNLIARCLTFPSAECVCFQRNSQIAFDNYTNQTTLNILNIPTINGNWTCRHGVSINDPAARVGIDLENVDVAFAYVLVIVLCLVFIGILVSVLVFVLLKCVRRRERAQTVEMVPLGGDI